MAHRWWIHYGWHARYGLLLHMQQKVLFLSVLLVTATPMRRSSLFAGRVDSLAYATSYTKCLICEGQKGRCVGRSTRPFDGCLYLALVEGYSKNGCSP